MSDSVSGRFTEADEESFITNRRVWAKAWVTSQLQESPAVVVNGRPIDGSEVFRRLLDAYPFPMPEVWPLLRCAPPATSQAIEEASLAPLTARVGILIDAYAQALIDAVPRLGPTVTAADGLIGVLRNPPAVPEALPYFQALRDVSAQLSVAVPAAFSSTESLQLGPEDAGRDGPTAVDVFPPGMASNNRLSLGPVAPRDERSTYFASIATMIKAGLQSPPVPGTERTELLAAYWHLQAERARLQLVIDRRPVPPEQAPACLSLETSAQRRRDGPAKEMAGPGSDPSFDASTAGPEAHGVGGAFVGFVASAILSVAAMGVMVLIGAPAAVGWVIASLSTVLIATNAARFVRATVRLARETTEEAEIEQSKPLTWDRAEDRGLAKAALLEIETMADGVEHMFALQCAADDVAFSDGALWGTPAIRAMMRRIDVGPAPAVESPDWPAYAEFVTKAELQRLDLGLAADSLAQGHELAGLRASLRDRGAEQESDIEIGDLAAGAEFQGQQQVSLVNTSQGSEAPASIERGIV